MVMPSATVASLTEATLVHTCTVTRRAQSAPSGVAAFDDYGEATLDSYATSATGVACFARRRAGAGEADEPGRALVAESWQVRFAADADVGVDDQLEDIADDAGATLAAGPLAITDLLIRAGHRLAVAQAAGLAGPTEVES